MGISEDARGGEEFARRNRCKRARSSGRLRAFVIFLATVWIAACSGSSEPPPPPPPVSGYVVKGPIAAATVNLYTITADGSKTLLGAPMPNDAFEFVPDPYSARQSPVRTIFNRRGALVAYDLSSSFNMYRYLYSGSVGELYGDGDIASAVGTEASHSTPQTTES
jgi:hypothetical protein